MLFTINHKATGYTKQGLPLRRNSVCPAFNPPDIQYVLCVLCLPVRARRQASSWLKKGNTSTNSTMSLRSRFIGALRIEQDLSASDSPMDMLLQRPAREPRPPARLRPGGTYAPEGTEKKPIVFRSRGVMQRPLFIMVKKSIDQGK
jgi:hypothetical protein